MSGLKSASLTPFGKSDKRTNKSPRKTYRFGFTLSDPSEDSCSVFDYGSVVKLEERKLIKKRREEKEHKANGSFNPFNDDEDDEDVKRLARKFEEKYGEKKGRSKTYAELGAGYDENDPFIDNTEAYDEELEEDQETPWGGYYVNSGPLELKKVDVSDHSDLDDVGKRKHKRVMSVLEEEDEEEKNEELDGEEEEVNDNDFDTETKSVIEEIVPEPKRVKIYNDKEEEAEEKSPKIIEGSEEPIKKKRKRLVSEDLASSGTTVIKPKKVKTVKALLEEKRVHEIQPTEEPKRQVASSTSINEAIESVINAGNHDENSNSSNSSKSGTSTSEDSQDGKPSSQNLPPPLPENLSPDLMTLVENIQHTAAVTDNTRKTFCTDINSSLIKLEWKSRDFSATNRNLLFAHLAFYLPCTKDTLMRRAKKLFILKEESQLENVICKLKATIDATMPTLEEKYEKERQRMIEEQGISASPSNGTVQGGNSIQTPESATGKLPKRRFPWSEEIRGYLKEIIRLKKRCYKVMKPRKNNYEEYIGHFLTSKVRVLWPPGWMKTSTLLRECSLYPHSGKSRHSSNQSPNKSDCSRLNASYPSMIANNSAGNVSLSTDPLPQSTRSPPPATDPINSLSKITTSVSVPSHPKSPKSEKPESFSMDCLLKRTSDITNCHEYNTTLSDIMKQDSVIMNGSSLPLRSVNSSKMDDSGKSEKVLDLSSCNNSVCGTPSVIQSVSSTERTAMRASDSVSLNTNIHHTPSPYKKEISSDLPLNRKQRLLQVSTQSSWLSQSAGSYDNVNKKTDCEPKWAQSTPKSSSTESKKMVKDLERRMSEETTTATDILSQIINESLKAPSTMGTEEKKGDTPVSKEQELLFDVMQDLRELNHMSSKQDYKKNSYTGVSWSQPTSKPVEKKSMTSAYHKEFLKHVFLTQENTPALTPPSPYSRHSVSPYENSPFMNDTSNSMYNSTPHRPAQNISSHTGSASSKVPQMNQNCGMKPISNTGISSGNPQRYTMDYPSNDQHLLGLPSSLPFGVHNWFSGSESQSHQ